MSTYDDYRTIDITIDGVNDYPAQIIVSTGDTDGRRIRAKFMVDGTPVTDATGAAIYYGNDNVPADSVAMTEETDGVYTGVIPTAAYAGKACATVTVGLKKGDSIVMSRSIRLIIDHAFGDDAPSDINGGDLENAINRAEQAADNAETSENNAKNSANAAKTSETNAASSASAAKTSANNAAASASSAQQAVDGFGLEVGTTTTGEPGTNAEVEIQKNGTKYTANFTIPRGDKGDQASLTHDDTLTGDGTSNTPLGVVDGTAINPVDNQWKAIDFDEFYNNGIYAFNGNQTNGPGVDWITGVLIVSRSYQLVAQLLIANPMPKSAFWYRYARTTQNSGPPTQAFEAWQRILCESDINDITTRLSTLESQVAALTAVSPTSATRLQALEARIKSLETN